ncbi:TPA: HAD-IB family phosphatase, partial [Campylobacter coli]|nr:phosphoserine phosphatase SerB [Campylobacter coli]ECW7493389.1 HAD-IB family phosphatase [Campylobacter coli]HEF9535375.1 HAD-IB family phosphatase [Campylobacter coli]
MIKLCVFDFDSTLMDGETIDILAKAYDKEKEVVDITHRAMAGELDFFESLQERVSFLKGMPYDLVLKIGQDLPLMNGAYELIEFLNSKNIFVVIFSGGFHEGIDPAMK